MLNHCLIFIHIICLMHLMHQTIIIVFVIYSLIICCLGGLMKNIISYSLYGNNPLYVEGAIINSIQAKEFYPDFVCYFSVYKDCSPEIIKKLEDNGAVVIVIDHPYLNEAEIISKCTLWRFYPLADASAQFILFRDCDSRLSKKEELAVREWMATDKQFHLMYDHPAHTVPIMAGMWGARGSSIPGFKQKLWSFIKKNDKHLLYRKSYDQDFLKHIIWPNYVKHSYHAHGDPASAYHQKLGIVLNPYPAHPAVQKNWFIGKTIHIIN